MRGFYRKEGSFVAGNCGRSCKTSIDPVGMIRRFPFSLSLVVVANGKWVITVSSAGIWNERPVSCCSLIKGVESQSNGG